MRLISIPSPHHSARRGVVPSICVWHWTGGIREAVDVAKIDYQRKKGKVSAHLTVGRDGTTVQSVRFERAAWHAGGGLFMGKARLNNHSFGIEVCNAGFRRESMEGKGLVWAEADHDNPRSRRSEWEVYSREQRFAIGDIVEMLEDKFGPLCHTGHEDVLNSYIGNARGAKLDPGPLFPWDVIQERTQGGVYRYDYQDALWRLHAEMI